MDFEPGQTVGDYEIIGVLGAGGMGKVYRVRNKISHRVEAMKVLLPDLTSDPELVERFLREIRISACLDHRNIAALRTAQRVDNQLLMVMEYVEGSTLDVLMQASRVPIGKAVDYTGQALSALSYAHARGVIHRDIKPGNIMLTPTGNVKLMDFGIAKLATDRKITKTGMMVGSVYYMSPEQIEGRDLDTRSDLYSLGIALYEMATGRRPFAGDSEYQIMAAHLKGTPPAPIEIDQSLPAALNEIILMALSKDPAHRFQSADAFRNALSASAPMPEIVPDAVPNAAVPVAGPAEAVMVPPKRDRRLFFMVAGSLATIAVIAGAVVEIPKYWHASAGSGASQIEVSSPAVTSVTEPTTKQPAPTQPAPTQPAPTQPAPTQPATERVAPIQSATTQAPPESPVTVERHAAIPAPAKPVKNRSTPAAGNPMQATPAGQELINTLPPAVAETPRQSEPRAAPVPEAGAAEIPALQERMMQMAARIGAVNATLQNLQRAQAQQGLGLRADMAAAQQRLGYQMDQAESGIQRNNPADAKKRLDAAERDLEKLENFLGK